MTKFTYKNYLKASDLEKRYIETYIFTKAEYHIKEGYSMGVIIKKIHTTTNYSLELCRYLISKNYGDYFIKKRLSKSKIKGLGYGL